ncbi:MAG: AMP-binding protein [Microbacteriaceae bacterium]|nr:AMP-binding protein [Microbacteriaceae bacterium]
MTSLSTALSGGEIYAPAGGEIPEVDALPGFQEIAVVVQTSGSSATPKRVALSAAALKASATATAKTIGEGPWILTLPINYIAGLQVINRALQAGTELVALEPSFSVAELSEALDRHNLEGAKISLVAAQLGRLLDEVEQVDLDGIGNGARANTAAIDSSLAKSIARIDTMLIGGGRIDPSLRERAAKLGWNTVATYGATETSGGCVYDGYPLPGVDLSLGENGLAISGPMLALGYLPPVPPADASRFFTESGKRWWVTGDRASVQQGRLSILGRNDRTVDVGGLKANLDELESIIGVPVVGIPDPKWGHTIVAFTLPEYIAKPDLVEMLKAKIGSHAIPRKFLSLEQYPLNANGKIDYQELTRTAQNEQKE